MAYLKIWKMTETLNGYIEGLDFADTPEDAEVLLVGGKSFKLSDYRNLKGIFKCGVGRDNIPCEEAHLLGIQVCFPDESTNAIIYEETANFTVAQIFASLYRNVGDFDSWTKNSRPALSNRKVLIIGVGNIGSRVKNKLRPFLQVLTYDIKDDNASDLNELIAEADAITLHIPLTAETQHFIDNKKLSMMKDGASLVNTARAALVDEEALYQELLKGRLFAAFDVFWEEPYSGKVNPLALDCLIRTPHIASTCIDFVEHLAIDLRAFIAELRKVDDK